ncbi:hypothetical protein AB0M92_37170 [Streptomyces sp. NPDC051582]|uniref:hypothetical protein n=1 Tax=Streptomyces sp. NPDC051582 TaxID=3155167 RepID=UPI003428FD6A
MLILVGSPFAVVGAAGLAGAPDPASILIDASVLGFGAWVVFRGFRLGLRIDGKGITDRTSTPGLALKGGEHIPLTSLASYSHRITEANLALLKALHATHLATCPGCA